jgi:NTE family protein
MSPRACACTRAVTIGFFRAALGLCARLLILLPQLVCDSHDRGLKGFARLVWLCRSLGPPITVAIRGKSVASAFVTPLMFPAVEIDGEPYWDGGFTGNPALGGFMRNLPKCDLMIVRIDPIHRNTLPRSSSEIVDRFLEISFSSTFWLELSAIAFILKLVDEGQLDRARFGCLLFYAIEASAVMEQFPASSKANNYAALLEYLFDLGRETVDSWFVRHRADLGNRSTIDLQQLLPVDF